MSRSISVKVKTSVLIKALEKKLEDNKKAIEHNDKEDKRYELALEKYKANILKTHAKNMKVLDVVYRNWTRKLDVTYEFHNDVIIPDAPVIDKKSTLLNWQIEEIENAIRILKLTDEETVNASTFKSISQYL